MYRWNRGLWTTPNHQKRWFFYRGGTNDWNTIQSAFREDEYGILSVDFKKNDVVLDIGAHIGAVTLLFTTCRPDLKIYAFEPMPENFDILEKNIRENAPESEVNIFRQAVWFYDDDKVKLYYGDNSQSGKIHKFIGSQFFVHDFYRPSVFKRVETVSLSKIFEENHIFSCKLIKLDAEGAEYGILKGTPKGVLEMIDQIHGEYHNIEPARIKKPRQKLLEQTKGVFRDATGFPEKGKIGPFVFVKK